jgi:hypothetical protein
MTGNRNVRDSLSLSDLDLEDLGLRLELAITRAVQPEAPVAGADLMPAAAVNRPLSGEPARSSGGLALDPD